MLVWEDPVPIQQWVAAQGGGSCAPGTFSALGSVENGDLIAGLVFHSTNGVNCFVNIALSEKRFPRALLRAGLFYVFKQLALKRLTFYISSSNISSQKLVTRLGAKREATLRSADVGGKDLLIYSLFPEDCWIWSVMQNGKKRGSPSEPGSSAYDSSSGCGES